LTLVIEIRHTPGRTLTFVKKKEHAEVCKKTRGVDVRGRNHLFVGVRLFVGVPKSMQSRSGTLAGTQEWDRKSGSLSKRKNCVPTPVID
jgi:hypothetical protein